MAGRPTVDEVSAPYANFMRAPAPTGPDTCRVCRTFTDGYPTCYRYAHQPDHLDVVVPITYAPSTEQMHTALRKHKDNPDAQVRTRFSRDLLAVFWRFIRAHERCLAGEAGIPAFDVMTTVASKTTARDDARDRLRAIVGEHAQPTAASYQRVAAGRFRGRRAALRCCPIPRDAAARWQCGAARRRHVDDRKLGAVRGGGLRDAGADAVALVVIGRYVKLEYSDHRQRLADLPLALTGARMRCIAPGCSCAASAAFALLSRVPAAGRSSRGDPRRWCCCGSGVDAARIAEVTALQHPPCAAMSMMARKQSSVTLRPPSHTSAQRPPLSSDRATPLPIKRASGSPRLRGRGGAPTLDPWPR